LAPAKVILVSGGSVETVVVLVVVDVVVPLVVVLVVGVVVVVVAVVVVVVVVVPNPLQATTVNPTSRTKTASKIRLLIVFPP
jgi:hypothetical protein